MDKCVSCDVMANMEVFVGEIAKIALKHLLKKYDVGEIYSSPAIVGYYKEENYYVCFDNSHWNCWVEQAKTEDMAIKWCLGLIEADELYFGKND
ncbi:hypothetical protein GCM10027037_25370 [Mucilaginibacter koreensis]